MGPRRPRVPTPLIEKLHEKQGDLPAAFGAIGSLSVTALVLLIGAVILATMLTQAFAFEAIRLQEGDRDRDA